MTLGSASQTPGHTRTGTLHMFSGATMAALDGSAAVTEPRSRQARLYL